MSHLATPPSSHSQIHLTGQYAHLFEPPKSTPTLNPGASSGDYFSSTSRKRSRRDSSHDVGSRYAQDWKTPTWSTELQSPGDEAVYSTFGTDSVQVNERYKLQGGLDTPSIVANTDLDRFSDRDAESRRMMRIPDFHARSGGPYLSGPLARERNGVARTYISPSSSMHRRKPDSWARFALKLPFSIAGRAFSFGTTVLKGFYAGGGRSYELTNSNPRHTISPLFNRWAPQAHGQISPLPGSWYDSPPSHAQQVNDNDDFLGDFEQDNPCSEQRPPNKRRQTDRDTWVLVGTPDVDASPPASPIRKSSGTPARRISRPGIARASSRRNIAPQSRRQSYTTATGSPAAPFAYSPSTHERRGSFTQSPHLLPSRQPSPRHSSPRQSSPRRSSLANNAEYVTPESKRIVRRQEKQERAADKAMSNMSRQLEDLIRQGQAALGTKFSVEDRPDEVEDEGFVDEL